VNTAHCILFILCIVFFSHSGVLTCACQNGFYEKCIRAELLLLKWFGQVQYPNRRSCSFFFDKGKMCHSEGLWYDTCLSGMSPNKNHIIIIFRFFFFFRVVGPSCSCGHDISVTSDGTFIHSFWLKDELFRFWWSKVKGQHSFGLVKAKSLSHLEGIS